MTNKWNEEAVELPLDEISHGDKELVKVGAAFYWSIGYADSKTGQRRRESITRFRRLPETVKREIEAAKKEAKRVRNAIGWR